ncbi:DNA-binding response regulator [Pseudomonas syringae pv. actinidiae]|uniref:DNA-binding response regulator n=2 Tax=Pseudomonas syringae pv. actinidiae TaxID=103796 RepID=A0A2V0QGB5_PSESF|nr:DNA-binding response regulator [Pseudomonas syringae pv. actinidiae]GBH16988.1 DNA-binding response regulator [Pseudomonas syringae pv. actinidiae]
MLDLRVCQQLRLACLILFKRQAATIQVFKRQLMAFFSAERTLFNSVMGGAAGDQRNGEYQDKRKHTVHLGASGRASFQE